VITTSSNVVQDIVDPAREFPDRLVSISIPLAGHLISLLQESFHIGKDPIDDSLITCESESALIRHGTGVEAAPGMKHLAGFIGIT
jgi:hypothetical protein